MVHLYFYQKEEMERRLLLVIGCMLIGLVGFVNGYATRVVPAEPTAHSPGLESGLEITNKESILKEKQEALDQQQAELERRQAELEEKTRLLEEKIEKRLNEEEMRAKQELGAKAEMLESFVPLIKAKDATTQAQVKGIVEIFKMSEDVETRNIGIYLSYVLR